MAFNSSNLILAIFGSGTNPTVWDYSTSDTISTTEGNNYYSDSRFFRLYDWVRVTASDGKAMYQIIGVNQGPDDIDLRKLAVASSFPAFP